MKKMPTTQHGNGGGPLKVVLCDGAFHECRDLHEPYIAVEVERDTATEVQVTLRTEPHYLSPAGQQQLKLLHVKYIAQHLVVKLPDATPRHCAPVSVWTWGGWIKGVTIDAVPQVVKDLQQLAQEEMTDEREPDPPTTIDRLATLLGLEHPRDVLEAEMLELRLQREQRREHQQLRTRQLV